MIWRASILPIKSLHCSGTFITGIDLSGNTSLEDLDLSNSPDLSFVDLRSGSNSILVHTNLQETPNLSCIEVDDPYAASNDIGSYALWQLSTTTSFAGGVNTWNGGSGNWDDASKWSMNRVPGTCENVVIDASFGNDVITVDPGATINILNMTVKNGDVQLGAGSVLHLHPGQ